MVSTRKLDWDHHKDKLRRFLLVDGLKIPDLQVKMENQVANVIRSLREKQYKSKFKEWGFRTNLKKEEWRVIGYKKLKRKREENKETEMILHEKSVGQERFNRQSTRYMTSLELNGIGIEGSSPKTPEGVELRTPKPEPDPLQDITAMTSMGGQEASIFSGDMMNLYALGSSAQQLTILPCVQLLSLLREKGVYERLIGTTEQSETLPLSHMLTEHPSLIFIKQTMTLISPTHNPSPAENSFNAFVYLMSNKLIKWDYKEAITAYTNIKKYLHPTALEFLFSLNSLAVEAMGEHLFQLAVWSGDATTVQFLLQRLKIDPNAQICDHYSFRVTPLEFACRHNSLDLVNVLLDAKADVTRADTLSCVFLPRKNILEDGEAENPVADILRSLIKAGAEINPQHSKPPLLQAIDHCDALAVSILLAAGANIKPDFWSPLGKAIDELNHFSIDYVLPVVSLLLGAGADPEEGFYEAAIGRHHSSFCDCLEIDGSDCTGDDEIDCLELGRYYECAIELAATFPNDELIRLLSQHGGHFCYHLLDFAAEEDILELAQDCLDHRVHRPRLSGWSAKRMTVKMATLILRYEPPNSDTVLFLAAKTEDLAFVRKVLADGAPVSWLAFERLAEWVGENMMTNLWKKCRKSDQIKNSHAMMELALRQSNLELLKALKEMELPFEIPKRRFSVLLTNIASQGNTQVLDFLISAEPSFRLNVHDFLSGLLLPAIKGNHKGMIDYLSKICPICGDKDGPSLIAAAIRNRDVALLQRLVQAGALINEVYYEDRPDAEMGFSDKKCVVRTVLSEAIEIGDRDMVHWLINAGADINARAFFSNQTLLSLAIQRKHMSIVSLLLETGADVNKKFGQSEMTMSSLEYAIDMGDIPLVGRLLSHGANVDDRALEASIGHQTRILLLLLTSYQTRHGHVYHGQGSGALNLAIRANDAEKVRLLLQFGAPVNWISPVYLKFSFFRRRYECSSAMATAIQILPNLDDSIFQLLLQYGASSINSPATMPISKTALIVAIEHDRVEVIDALIHLHANLNQPATWDHPRTPLQLAVEKGNSKVVEMLLHHGADVHAPAFFKRGATALQLACIQGDIHLIQMLLNAGASVDALPAKVDGRTAVEGAAEHGHLSALALILTLLSKSDERGRRKLNDARDLARKNGHFAVVRLLDSYIDRNI
ncbi:hypothetical protein N7528_007377 [Penicillium herquei]|nr:hypothetical protein N7528_007377 [Penicillium herquei]